MTSTKKLAIAFPFLIALGAAACSGESQSGDASITEQELAQLQAGEIPMAGPTLESGTVTWCGQGPMKIVTGSDLTTEGSPIPNKLKGTVKTEKGDVKLDVDIEVHIPDFTKFYVTGGSTTFKSKTVELLPSEVNMNISMLQIQSMDGTVKAKGCPKGIVMDISFNND